MFGGKLHPKIAVSNSGGRPPDPIHKLTADIPGKLLRCPVPELHRD